ncbi:MAG: hypothetical protein MJE68_07675 [Proteobacteria bacterium]|nr:hypothetical protein [Pseudomonadota bacterium]
MARKQTKAEVRALQGKTRADASAEAERMRITRDQAHLDRVESRQEKSEARIGGLELLFGIVSALMIATILFVGTHSYMVLKENRELREQVYYLQVNDELQKREIQDLHDKLDGGEG